MSDEYSPWTGSSDGLQVLPGEGGGERAETGLTVPTDDFGYVGETGLPPGVTPGTPGSGWGTPGAWGTFLTDMEQGRFGNALSSLFGGGYGQLSQLAAFGGIAALLNKMFGSQQQQPVGYQGGIPKFTYERAQTPVAQQRPENYRPGQGGISYFAPGKFVPAGYTPKTAEEFLVAPPPPPPPAPGAAAGGSMPGGIASLAQGGSHDIVMLNRGRYLKGNGDGVSDSIPARFAGSGEEARLADGEFVVPARVVSEIGNGSSDAGARKLYAMLDRVEARAKKSKRGKPSGADRELNKLA